MICLLFFVCSSLIIRADEKRAPESSDYVGREICEGCHTDYGKSFHLTAHSKVPGTAPDALNQCESCHGPGYEHAASGGKKAAGIVNFEKLDGKKASAQCVKCHEGKPGLYGWRFCRHGTTNVSCNDCHYSHDKEKKNVAPHQLKNGGDPEVCYTCHSEKKAQAQWPSHHPVYEKRITCSDCHNPHGSDLSAYKGAPTSRELCLTCHAQYRGPFAWEHQPVSENCTSCHNPHGSMENNLLAASEPFLCLRCHPAVHNPHMSAGALSNNQLQSEVMSFSRCSLCHPNVHGSGQSRTYTR